MGEGEGKKQLNKTATLTTAHLQKELVKKSLTTAHISQALAKIPAKGPNQTTQPVVNSAPKAQIDGKGE